MDVQRDGRASRRALLEGLFGSLMNPTVPDVTVPESCEGCGACCSHLVANLLSGDEKLIPPELWDTHGGGRFPGSGIAAMKRDSSGRCVALDRETNRCTIYAQRPHSCRAFTRGSDACRKAIERRGAGE
ncbi:MAG: YkgJ family cysteine cluster protein [Chloroflexi bacterium]|nr:YkgJ family cysteine cluster protein [Chloroflexota bacterium]